MIDKALVTIIAGKGGDGASTFRREKYVPRGGPNGGDGGDGGDVILRANPQLTTLSEFVRAKVFKAPDGKAGAKQRKHGRSGEDLYLEVPLGTEIYLNSDGMVIKVADITNKEDSYRATKGGKGGLGNSNFATSTHQTPHEFTPGQPGETKEFNLNLKLIADVGIIGLPNVGKSTFISLVSKARPKIGNYAFTTIEPNLGKVDYKGASFVVADIPGLISGASEGRGLGDQFLRHVERTRILIHCVSGDSLEPEKDYTTVRKELELYSPSLIEKSEIVVISRFDLVNEENNKAIKSFIKKHMALKLTQTNPKTAEPILDRAIEYLSP